MPKGIYKRPSFEEIFWSKVKKTATCWIWTASKDKVGYGQIGTREPFSKVKCFRPHRVAYELIKGRIPKGLQLDHLCRNTSCVNPNHLEAVTARVNILRGNGIAAKNAVKTHCNRGHPLSGANLRISINKKNGNKIRICKECQRISLRKTRKIKRSLTEKGDE